MDQTLAIAEQNQLAPADVVAQVKLVQEVMKSVMREGEHYGTIPGTPKPTLYKAGAEKLSLTFRFAADFTVETIDFPMYEGHREVRVLCKLTHIPTGKFWGSGVGSCSTMESKYRYRQGFEVVKNEHGVPLAVPGKYWKDKDVSLLGGKGHKAKKIDGEWLIVKDSEEKIEYENPADYYNTVLKMAKKRAHVDAVISATAASDILTQDLEDLPNMPAPKEPAKPAQSAYEETEGLVSGASHKPSTNGKGIETGGTTFYATIENTAGKLNIWTKDVDLGQELLDANGSTVVITFLRGKMIHQLKTLEVIHRTSDLDTEPDDLNMGQGEPSQEATHVA